MQRLVAIRRVVLLTHLLEHLRGGQPRVEVGRIDPAEAHDDLRFPPAVAPGLALRGHRVEVRLRVGEQSLQRGDLRELQLGGFVVLVDLEDFLVERGGLRVEAVAHEVLGDARVLADGEIGLAGARVEVTKRVRGVPVARLVLDQPDVFGDGAVQTTLTEKLLRLFQRVVAVEGQRASPRAGDAGERRRGSVHPIKQ